MYTSPVLPSIGDAKRLGAQPWANSICGCSGGRKQRRAATASAGKCETERDERIGCSAAYGGRPGCDLASAMTSGRRRGIASLPSAANEERVAIACEHDAARGLFYHTKMDVERAPGGSRQNSKELFLA